MALVSFSLRQASEGSSLRNASPSTDNGLRADNYFPPIPEASLSSTFEANIYFRDRIDVRWSLATPLSVPSGTTFSPVEIKIVGSNYGEPVTSEDGIIIDTVTLANYKTEILDYKNTTLIQPGRWIYLAMFVKYADETTGTSFYERVAVLSIQVPYDFGSTELLWKRVPAYYRELDGMQELLQSGQTPLYAFVELFGWELDKARTTIYETMRVNDPEVIHSSAIDALANQVGLEITKSALGTAKVRALLNNIGYLRRNKGTAQSISAYISAITGCGVSESLVGSVNTFNVHPMRVNLFTDPFFATAPTINGTWDSTNKIYRMATVVASSGRSYGWGVYVKGSSTVTTAPTVTHVDGKLTITLAAGTGNSTVVVYSRGTFAYNPAITYYGSANTTAVPKLRFLASSTSPTLSVTNLESGTGSLTFFDDGSSTNTYADNYGTGRTIVSSATTSTGTDPVIPCFVYTVTHGASPTVITFEKPLVEYRHSDGNFFSGSSTEGGFLPNGSGGGSYDYHWGVLGASSANTDFSYYTLDYSRSKQVAYNVITNYVAPVNMVYGDSADYVITWDVLE